MSCFTGFDSARVNWLANDLACSDGLAGTDSAHWPGLMTLADVSRTAMAEFWFTRSNDASDWRRDADFDATSVNWRANRCDGSDMAIVDWNANRRARIDFASRWWRANGSAVRTGDNAT